MDQIVSIARVRRDQKVRLSRTANKDQAPADHDATLQDTDSDLLPEGFAQAVEDGLANGDIGAVTVLALDLLERRTVEGDPWAPTLHVLLSACHEALGRIGPLDEIARQPIAYDDRLAALFEQIVTLLRQQDTQMRELQSLVNDLL